MTFREWETTHDTKLNAILTKLSGVSIDNTIAYFDFENMVVMEPDFCPLYATNTKCHDIPKLNCFFCACPHFRSSDTEPFYMDGDVAVMSICSINAKQAGSFTHEGTKQCDCSGCHIPHTERVISAYLRKIMSQKEIPNNYSFLDVIRNYQLSGILGKWMVW